MKRKVFWASIVFFLVGLVGCSGSIPAIRQVAGRPSVEPGGGTKPIMFKKVISLVPRGKMIGEMRTGSLCSYKGPLCWKSEKAIVPDAELGEMLRQRMQAAGYTLVGDPDALFEDRSAEKAEFLIAGRIRDVGANVCFPRAASDDWVTAKGGIYMQVEWELYSKKARDVVLKITTEGSSGDTGRRDTYQELLLRAFGAAVQNLLADVRLYRTVALDSSVPVKQVKEDKTELKVRFKTAAETTGKGGMVREGALGEMRSAVVTVFSGSGHGSGFVISPDGYVLTDEHVVGGASFVNVKFVTGKEVAGQVVRVSKVRDVALIRLEKDIYPYLPLGNTASVNIGDEVFCIGTPLSEDLFQTVTKGIISSFRVRNEIKYVQSDVSIHPGNSGGPLVSLDKGVVGMCVSGITFGPYTLGLNYFIPIEEAIKALKITKEAL